MGQQQIDASGRCALHPGIQLHHQKKNGEWRILLNACPLCVSGLPATGQPVSTPASRAAAQALVAPEEQSVVGKDIASMLEQREKKKDKSKKKLKSPRSRDEARAAILNNAAEDGQDGGDDSAAKKQQRNLTEELDEKIQKKKMSKSKSAKAKAKDGSGRSGSGGRSGSNGGRSSKRDSHSATPPAARPRSPSPQTPLRTEEQQPPGVVLGATTSNDNNHQASQLQPASAASDSGWVNKKMEEDYNKFLEFMTGDSTGEHHHAPQGQQQQQQQVAQGQAEDQFFQQAEEQDMHYSQHSSQQSQQRSSFEEANNMYCAPIMSSMTGGSSSIDHSGRSGYSSRSDYSHEYSAADTMSNVDSIQSQGASSFHDDFDDDTTSDNSNDGEDTMSNKVDQMVQQFQAQKADQQFRNQQQVQQQPLPNQQAQQQHASSPQLQHFQQSQNNVHVIPQTNSFPQSSSTSELHFRQSHGIPQTNSSPQSSSTSELRSSITSELRNIINDTQSFPPSSGDMNSNEAPPRSPPLIRRKPSQNNHNIHGRNQVARSRSTPPRPTQPHQARNRSKSPYKSPYRAHAVHAPANQQQPASSAPELPEPNSLRQGTAEPLSRRPDPEDVSEFNQGIVYNGGNHGGVGHAQHLAHPPPPPPPPPVHSPIIQSSPKRVGYPVQLQQQQQLQPQPQLRQLYSNGSQDSGTPEEDNTTKVLEQDDVSVMSMSSVTRNMYKIQQAQLQLLQQKQLQKVQPDEEDSDSSDDESDSEENPRSSSIGSSNKFSSNRSSNSDDRSASHSTSNYSSNTGPNAGSRSFNTGADGEINTCDFDDRGRCRRHPTVKLRKKQFMRGWKVVLSNCPECCLDEMRRVKDVRIRNRQQMRLEEGSRTGSKTSKGSRTSKGSSKGSSGGRSGKKKKKKKSKTPPIAQLNLRSAGDNINDTDKGGGEEYDDTRSIGTASTITISSYTHSTGGGRTWQNYANDGSSVASGRSTGSNRSNGSNGSGNDNRSLGSNNENNESSSQRSNSPPIIAKVTRMPYTDAYGENGWYTGQVDSTTGTPYGLGTMNYSNGAIYEGEWKDGVSMTPSKTREEPASFNPAKIVPRGNLLHGHHRQMHQHTLGRGSLSHHHQPSVGRSYLATLNEDGTSSDYEYASSGMRRTGSSSGLSLGGVSQSSFDSQPQQQPPQRAVECGMRWIDPSGDIGAYTGEVNDMNVPDGMGSMRYDDGMVAEGMWRDGELNNDDDDDDSDSSRSSSDSEDEDDQGRIGNSSGNFQQQGYGLAPIGGGDGYHQRAGGAAPVH